MSENKSDGLPQIGEGNMEDKRYEINFIMQSRIWEQNE